MNILTKIDDYLNEKKDGMSIGLQKALSTFGLPEKGTQIVKFWQGPDKMYWVIIVKFKNKHYGTDSYGEMWTGDVKKIINNIKTNSGIDFSGSKPKTIR